jgi:hypothetical protein
MSKPCVYILGSGPSLLSLTPEEVAYLNRQPAVLSLNQYLIFWEKIGVIPKCHMMADGQYPAIKLLMETQEAIMQLEEPITYYINRRYLHYFPRGLNWRVWKHGIRKRLQLWRQHRYAPPLRTPQEHLVTFSQVSEAPNAHLMDENGWYWAQSLEDPLYFHRGTLTSAINLAAIVWPDADIALLGVDLNTYGHFFDLDWDQDRWKEHEVFNRKRLSDLSAVHHEKSRAMNTHATAVEYDQDDEDSIPGIQAAFPLMQAELAKTGRTLYCCNPDSLLVTDGILPYAPVLPETLDASPIVYQD